jgi:hypothetical protein
MNRTHKRDPGPMVNPIVRDLLRRRRDYVELEISLTERKTDVRLTLPKIAWEIYESEIPAATKARYHPRHHMVVLDLPNPGVPADV